MKLISFSLIICEMKVHESINDEREILFQGEKPS